MCQGEWALHILSLIYKLESRSHKLARRTRSIWNWLKSKTSKANTTFLRNERMNSQTAKTMTFSQWIFQTSKMTKMMAQRCKIKAWISLLAWLSKHFTWSKRQEFLCQMRVRRRTKFLLSRLASLISTSFNTLQRSINICDSDSNSSMQSIYRSSEMCQRRSTNSIMIQATTSSSVFEVWVL